MIKGIKIFRRQSGISLLEVLLSLSIIAIILIMATRYFFVANHNDKVNTTISQVGALVAIAHSWKGAEYTYANISTDILAKEGELVNFPGFDSNTKILYTMWGKRITINSDNSQPNLATISIPLPDNVCDAIQRAYPGDTSANITSNCTNNVFHYTFP